MFFVPWRLFVFVMVRHASAVMDSQPPHKHKHGNPSCPTKFPPNLLRTPDCSRRSSPSPAPHQLTVCTLEGMDKLGGNWKDWFFQCDNSFCHPARIHMARPQRLSQRSEATEAEGGEQGTIFPGRRERPQIATNEPQPKKRCSHQPYHQAHSQRNGNVCKTPGGTWGHLGPTCGLPHRPPARSGSHGLRSASRHRGKQTPAVQEHSRTTQLHVAALPPL